MSSSGYPSATSQSSLPGHAAPQMATPLKSDGSTMRVDPDAQANFIKTLPRKDVSFGAQAAMDRDRQTPMVKQTELYSTQAHTSTGTMTNEKQISTFDTQVAAHTPAVHERGHYLPASISGMANRAKEMIFGHSETKPATPPMSTSTITTTTTYPTDSESRFALDNATQSMGQPTWDKSAETRTSPGATNRTMKEKASDLMEREKNVMTNALDKTKEFVTKEQAALSSGAHNAVNKTKDFMAKEQAALSSGAQKLSDKTKDMLGNGPHVKTVSHTSIRRVPDRELDDSVDTIVQEQDFLEPAIHKSNHASMSSVVREPLKTSAEMPQLYGSMGLKRVPQSPTLMDQIASRDPSAIGAEPEDAMAMYMAEKYRGQHLH